MEREGCDSPSFLLLFLYCCASQLPLHITQKEKVRFHRLVDSSQLPTSLLRTMSTEESRKSNPGAPAAKSSSEERKPSSAGPGGRRIVIKSADMKDDMQKEAVDIAVAVRLITLPPTTPLPKSIFCSSYRLVNDSPFSSEVLCGERILRLVFASLFILVTRCNYDP